ncbi:hypothetical protein HA402_005766 [Bradysia odoriphaga]|nr:hypothetical protein HA402_005766 [Bradysia odoriphaga]
MATSLSQIVFENNPQKVCYSGQLLKGLVKLLFPSNIRVEAIYIKCVGEGFYSWVEDISDRVITGTTQYLVQRINLVPRSTAGVDVSAGSNQYPFEIQLPSHLPTSFEGKYGHIRYTLALSIIPLGMTSDPAPIVETFTIIRPLNLNGGFAFIMPTSVGKATHFNFSFTRLCVLYRWRKGYLKMFGRLPVSGYCPGQIMNLQLDVINESGQGVLMIVVHFVQV